MNKYLRILPVFLAVSALFFFGCGGGDGSGNTGDHFGPAPEGLVHYWPLNGDANDGVEGGIDLSPGQSPNWVNDAEWGRTVLETDTNSDVYYALPFDQDFGSPGYGELTVAFWIKQRDVSARLNNIFKLEEGTNENGWFFYFAINMGYIGLSNAGFDETGFGTIDEGKYAGKWTHYALTFEPGKAALFINGYSYGPPVTGDDGSGEFSKLPSWNNGTGHFDIRAPLLDTITIGGEFPGQYFDGRIADFRMYNRVLSADEILAVYGLAPAAVRGK